LKKISLLGDSVIDNKSYVQYGQNSVLEHLESLSNYTYQQTAVDGDTTHDMLNSQMFSSEIENSSNIVLSIGGNDLLQSIHLMFEDNSSINDSISGFQNFIFKPLEKRFETIVETLSSHGAKLLLCTVYEGDLGRTNEFRDVLDSSKIMVSAFNDIVYKTAKKFGSDVLELRHIFTSSEDYANPIEPSHIGGEKLAKAIIKWVEVDET